MLQVTDLRVAYGAVSALAGVSLSVEAGVTTAVLGANGAGKTSLLRAMTGMVRARSGTVTWKGTELTRLPSEEIVRRGVAHVPEGRGVIQDLTVEENLRLGGLWRSDREDRRRALDEMYEFFPPLRERRKRSAYTLSGGERQMLAVGRALMARPELLLLDEPAASLDLGSREELLALLSGFAQSKNSPAMIMVTHHVEEIPQGFTNAMLLAKGKVVAQGTLSDVVTAKMLTKTFGIPLELTSSKGRFAARAS